MSEKIDVTFDDGALHMYARSSRTETTHGPYTLMSVAWSHDDHEWVHELLLDVNRMDDEERRETVVVLRAWGVRHLLKSFPSNDAFDSIVGPVFGVPGLSRKKPQAKA